MCEYSNDKRKGENNPMNNIVEPIDQLIALFQIIPTAIPVAQISIIEIING